MHSVLILVYLYIRRDTYSVIYSSAHKNDNNERVNLHSGQQVSLVTLTEAAVTFGY